MSLHPSHASIGTGARPSSNASGDGQNMVRLIARAAETHASPPAWPTGPLLPPRAGAAGRLFHGDTE